MQNHLLSSAGKVSLNTSKELAQRNLDSAPTQRTFNDHRSIAKKVASGVLIDYEKHEICHDHKGEAIIAMETTADNETVFGCNKCVFERKLTKPVFLAY